MNVYQERKYNNYNELLRLTAEGMTSYQLGAILNKPYQTVSQQCLMLCHLGLMTVQKKIVTNSKTKSNVFKAIKSHFPMDQYLEHLDDCSDRMSESVRAGQIAKKEKNASSESIASYKHNPDSTHFQDLYKQQSAAARKEQKSKRVFAGVASYDSF